jgi:phenol 2-monooxygenase
MITSRDENLLYREFLDLALLRRLSPISFPSDACHTHSSGSAQGLNTGSHDAINLAWKLSMVLRDQAKPELLETYARERQALVKNVIENDTVIATLIGGQYPRGYETRAGSYSTKQLLKEWFESAANQGFTLGLGIKYGTWPDSRS